MYFLSLGVKGLLIPAIASGTSLLINIFLKSRLSDSRTQGNAIEALWDETVKDFKEAAQWACDRLNLVPRVYPPPPPERDPGNEVATALFWEGCVTDGWKQDDIFRTSERSLSTSWISKRRRLTGNRAQALPRHSHGKQPGTELLVGVITSCYP